MVKQVQAGCVLIRLLNTLPHNRKILPKIRTKFPIPDAGAGQHPANFPVFHYLCVRFFAKST